MDKGEGARHMPNADGFSSENHSLEWLEPLPWRKGIPRRPEKSRRNAEVFALPLPRNMGFVLPTRKIVDAIYQQSAFHFAPEPMRAGPQMRSTE